jgi:hypothetical protein
METRHLVTIGVVVLIIIGLIWLSTLLPGTGFFGGNGGNGTGPTGPTAATGPTLPTQVLPPVGERAIVVVGRTWAEIRYEGRTEKVAFAGPETDAAAWVDQLEKWAKEGRKFDVKRTKDVPDWLVRRLRQAQDKTAGNIFVTEEFVSP